MARVLEFQLQHQSFQRNPRADLLQNGLVRSPCSPRDSQESSPAPQFESINSLVFSLLYGQLKLILEKTEKPEIKLPTSAGSSKKQESEKVGLKLNIQKTKTMASGPITSWKIDGETVETVSDFILGGSKITADGDCSHEIKRCLLLGRKVITNLDSIFKSRDITLPTKVRLVKAMVFPVVMYGCESWTVKKAEHRRIDVFGEDS